MLKIEKLNIEILTEDKKFGREIEFLTSGLNIIKGDNHCGKSTIASSIFYALGMEELLGGKNTIALDSILTTSVPIEGKDYDKKIIKSSVSLTIANSSNKHITIKRYIKHYEISPKIVDVYDNNTIESYYLHDSGGAQNQRGFHKYLENFLGMSLPKVPLYEGGETYLYLQYIFSAFFIEQLRGWTDFFASIPSYGIKEPKKRIIEYLLNLNTFQFELDKNKYDENKKNLINEWEKTYINLIELAESAFGRITNLENKVIGKDTFNKTKYEILFKNDNKEVGLEEYLEIMKSSKNEIEKVLNKPKSHTEQKLQELRKKLNKNLEKSSEIEINIKMRKANLNDLKEEQNHLKYEHDRLKGMLKIEELKPSLSNMNQLLKGKCPTCNQEISDSLNKSIKIMNVEENKKYIESQQSILKNYILTIEKKIHNETLLFEELKKTYEYDKSIIEYLEKDMEMNSSLPSMASMKEMVLLEDKIKKVENIKSGYLKLYQEFKNIANKWDNNELLKSDYPMSQEDINKLNLLTSSFKDLTTDFKYGSKREDQLKISWGGSSKYFPIVTIDKDTQPIKNNSSASDFVRSLWAYLISLYKVSSIKNGNHQGILLFDEPAQHAMTESSQKAFFKELSNLGCQSIVFASFENTQKDIIDKFDEITKGLDIKKYRVIPIEKRAIIELNNK